MDDRYQFQPWYVRAYRWWRYMPLAAFKFARWAIVWFMFGCAFHPQWLQYMDNPQKPYRWMLDHMWNLFRSQACTRMKYCRSLTEWLEQLNGGVTSVLTTPPPKR